MKRFCRLMELDGVGKRWQTACVCSAMAVWVVCRWMSGSNGSSGTSLPGQDPFPQFGSEAGIVQQYLFFYKRSVG